MDVLSLVIGYGNIVSALRGKMRANKIIQFLCLFTVLNKASWTYMKNTLVKTNDASI